MKATIEPLVVDRTVVLTLTESEAAILRLYLGNAEGARNLTDVTDALYDALVEIGV